MTQPFFQRLREYYLKVAAVRMGFAANRSFSRSMAAISGCTEGERVTAGWKDSVTGKIRRISRTDAPAPSGSA
jgi:hypothetical protein